MKNRIITISREFGSGGHTIGELVAKKLGIAFYDKQIVDEAAKRSGYSSDFINERGEYAPATNSFLFGLTLASQARNSAYNLSPADQLFIHQNNIIRELSEKEPCVIVGRCANFVLKERKDVLNVFIYASPEARCVRVLERYGDNGVKPSVRIKKKDDARKVYYKHYTGEDWGVCKNYHISLDSEKLGIEACADIIVKLYKGEL